MMNPSGAKPILTAIFEAELTPNLRSIGFFPVTHRLALVRTMWVSLPLETYESVNPTIVHGFFVLDGPVPATGEQLQGEYGRANGTLNGAIATRMAMRRCSTHGANARLRR